MKLKMILCAALALVMLWGCAPAVEPTTPTAQPTVTPTTAPTAKPTTPPTAAPTAAPTDAPTEPVIVDPEFPMGYFDQIKVHPFSQDEMAAALNLLNTKLATTSDKEEVQSYETHWVSFDPYGTLISIQDQMNNAPVDGWEKDDYFARKMVFVVCFSVDVADANGTDYTQQLGTVTLVRDTNDGEWKIDVAACSVETFCTPSTMIMPPEIAKTIDPKQAYILAGYHDAAVGEYFMYVLGENNTVACYSYYAAKPN